jgi:hypothetical protein
LPVDLAAVEASLPEGVSVTKRTARHAILVGPAGGRLYLPLDGRGMAYSAGLDVGWEGNKLSCKGDDAQALVAAAVAALAAQERRQRRKRGGRADWPPDLAVRRARLDRILALLRERGHVRASELDATGRIADPIAFYAGVKDLVAAGLMPAPERSPENPGGVSCVMEMMAVKRASGYDPIASDEELNPKEPADG